MENISTNLMDQTKLILDEALFLNGRTKDWTSQMPLLGNIPELDSMAVMNVVAGLEGHFEIFMEDEEINAEVFATLQTLTHYIYQKLNLNYLSPIA